jgi:hypothetical protein
MTEGVLISYVVAIAWLHHPRSYAALW